MLEKLVLDTLLLFTKLSVRVVEKQLRYKRRVVERRSVGGKCLLKSEYGKVSPW